ncbi:MAG TPA: Hsp20/alpha crystallin family protein [Vitreimonas sp.]|uniref:Hsp20/alpha crystallin family protein n=1 Tax=Vitreimonas sp. TaxID=3069702 RepID=UPI002D73AD9B|nr:Hsp20/alpha crystallin family protein [Vitreimonas sp.]HYD86395.1 Hsp20/alpha crystallin family protein [Vitreimonas sp.]
MNNLVPGRRSRPGAMSPFLALQQEMNRLFDDAFTGALSPFGEDGRSFGWPSVEVSETDKEVKITAELAGLEEKDIEISVDDDTLTLSGERRTETDDKERRYSERYYGRFERRLTLPAAVDDQKAKATFKNGVLTVTLPKRDNGGAKTKRIPIQA